MVHLTVSGSGGRVMSGGGGRAMSGGGGRTMSGGGGRMRPRRVGQWRPSHVGRWRPRAAAPCRVALMGHGTYQCRWLCYSTCIGFNCPGFVDFVPGDLVAEGFTTSLLLVPDVGQTAIITANSKFIFSQSRMCYANRSGFTINTLLKLQYSN